MLTSDISFAGQVVVVTGAASGIGRACAQRFARQQATLIMLDRDAGSLASALAELGPEITAQIVVCDVAESNAVQACFDSLKSQHGKIDILVNCAGVNRLHRHFAHTTAQDWDTVLAVNLSGMFYCCHAVMDGMRDRGNGTIVNFASWAGRRAGFFTGPAYSASKRAVLSLTESINIEEGLHGVRATAIVPEEVATALIDNRPEKPTPEERARMLEPDDVARAVVFAAGLPPRVCINELVISPTWNRDYLGLHKTALTALAQKS